MRRGGGKLPVVWNAMLPETDAPSLPRRSWPATSITMPSCWALICIFFPSFTLGSNPTDCSVKTGFPFLSETVFILKSTHGASWSDTKFNSKTCSRYTLLPKSCIKSLRQMLVAKLSSSCNQASMSFWIVISSSMVVSVNNCVVKRAVAPNSIWPVRRFKSKCGPRRLNNVRLRASTLLLLERKAVDVVEWIWRKLLMGEKEKASLTWSQEKQNSSSVIHSVVAATWSPLKSFMMMRGACIYMYRYTRVIDW